MIDQPLVNHFVVSKGKQQKQHHHYKPKVSISGCDQTFEELAECFLLHSFILHACLFASAATCPLKNQGGGRGNKTGKLKENKPGSIHFTKHNNNDIDQIAYNTLRSFSLILVVNYMVGRDTLAVWK